MNLMENIAYYRNVYDLITTEAGVIPVRFSRQQLEHYAESPVYKMRSMCPSGIAFELVTDAVWIKMDYEIKGNTRNYCYFDVLIDDIQTTSIEEKNYTQASGSWTYHIPQVSSEQERKITVYLPHNAELIIKCIRLSEGASVHPVQRGERPRLLCLGDSITQGMDARHPYVTYPVAVARHLGWDMLNQGIGGYVFNQDSLDESLSFRPDWITIAYGTNDWGKCDTLLSFQLNCRAYMDNIVRIFPHSRILLFTPLWRHNQDEHKQTGTLQDIRHSMEEIGAAYPSVHVVDGLSLVPHEEHLYVDGVHPSDEGFGHYAQQIIARLD